MSIQDFTDDLIMIPGHITKWSVEQIENWLSKARFRVAKIQKIAFEKVISIHCS